MKLTDPELVRSITRDWQGERDAHGRPLVPVDVLRRMELVTTEEAWGVLRPHLAQEVVETSERVRLRDEFGQQRIREGIYTPGEVDRPFSDEMETDFLRWRAEREPA